MKRQAYGADVTYGTNEFGFDYLRGQHGHVPRPDGAAQPRLRDRSTRLDPGFGRGPAPIISGQVGDAAALYYKCEHFAPDPGPRRRGPG